MAKSESPTPALDSVTPIPRSPWGALSGAAVTTNTSLAEVMSEQLASEMIKKDLDTLPAHTETDLDDIPAEILLEASREATLTDPECTDDYLIAHMLQMQFDKEYDEILHNEESQHNGTSKVRVSYSKYKVSRSL